MIRSLQPSSALLLLAAVASASAAAGYLLATRRRRLGYDPLVRRDAPASPVELLRRWLASEPAPGPPYMVVATSSPAEGATARTVVLQELGDGGALTFGTATESLKARSLAADPRCEAVLRSGHRQVRVRGVARRATADERARSWRAQPPGARSSLPHLDQGAPVGEKAWAALAESLRAAPLDASPPACYEAFVLEPRTIEFYSGGHDRFLNDRYLYVKKKDGAWDSPRRLQP